MQTVISVQATSDAITLYMKILTLSISVELRKLRAFRKSLLRKVYFEFLPKITITESGYVANNIAKLSEVRNSAVLRKCPPVSLK